MIAWNGISGKIPESRFDAQKSASLGESCQGASYMGNRVSTFAKRQRELDQKERAKERAQRRDDRRARKDKGPREAGDDPDIAGIVPGPQAPNDPE
jgi:hypothetical protein